jgi:tetratricopeptide (TPR) repeat protein
MEANRAFTPHGAPIHDVKLLPIQPPAQVIGRNRELASMHVALKVGSSVFLSGEPGIGKTALAAILATAYIASHPSGVLWFNIIEDDFVALIGRIGRAYGLSALTGSNEDPSSNFDMVQAVLEQNRPLIVLDGIIDIEATRDFVRQCASKTPVLIINEQPGSGPWTPVTLEPLSDEDSIALFKQISGLQDSLYNPDISGLVKFLDGNPLAIELAAREVTVDDMLPAELLTTLPSSTGRDGTMTMMALVFKRMPPPVQAMMMVLAAMFTGSASAELISDLSGVPAVNIIPLMRQLVARGVAFESAVYGQFSYTLHELAQSYTRNWLQQYQRLLNIENSALKAVLTYVERHAQSGTAHHDRLAAEMGNIVGAAAYATSTGQARALRQLIHALSQSAEKFVHIRGFGPELDQMIKLTSLLGASSADATQVMPVVRSKVATGSARAVRSTQSAAQVTVPESAQPTRPVQITEPPVDIQATPNVPFTRRVPKSPPASAPEFEEETQAIGITVPSRPPKALEETQPTGSDDTGALEAALADLSRSLVETPAVVIDEPPVAEDDTDIPTERSLPTLQTKLEEARAEGQRLRQAKLLHAMGEYYAEQGDRQQATTYHKQALEMYETVDNIDGMLATLDTLAELTAQADDAEGALIYATRGVNLAEKLGDRTRLGRLQARLADVRLALGDLAAATETYTQAVESLRTTEDWLTIGLVMSKLGNAYLEQRRFEEAIMILEQTLAIFHKEKRNDYAGRVLGGIGAAYDGMQQWAKAQGYFEQALTFARQSGDQEGEVAQLNAIAHVRQMEGDLPGTIIYYRQALHVAYQLEDIDLQAALTFELGTLLIDNPNTLIMGLQLLRESDETVPNSEARRLMGRANKRLERANAAGLSVAPAELSSREYAEAAYQRK